MEINLDYSQLSKYSKLIFNYNLLNWYEYLNIVKEVLLSTAGVLVPFKEKMMKY